ncbi:MAG: ATP-binding protein [Nitrospirota bacterium]
MKLHINKSRRALIIIICILSPFFWLTDRWFKKVLLDEKRQEFLLSLQQRAQALDQAVYTRFALLNGLYSFTLAGSSDSYFDKYFYHFAAGLYITANGIRNFSIAPNGIQKYIYPFKGNENMPGHDLINDKRPDVRRDVQRAIKTGQVALSGPYNLRQGGLGLVARRAVYVKDKFWGLVAMVIDVPPILKEAGLYDPQDMEFALRRGDGEVFYGSKQVYEDLPTVMTINLPEGHWVLAGIPRAGWDAVIQPSLTRLRVLSVLIYILIAELSYLIYNRQLHLKSEIAMRTAELEERNKELMNEMSQREILENELNKQRQLESIGLLAGGIAHDFNNLLAGIMNNIYLLKKRIVIDDDKVQRNLLSVEKAINRATNLTQQLLTFAKGGAPVLKTASIVELIRESAEFAIKGSNTKCEFEAAGDIRPVEVDEGQISQVIHNLVLNADQSMPEGGTIRVFLENISLGPENEYLLREGNYVKIVIEDQGVGIEKDNLKKIFDPYFTTKDMGRGLGLTTTYSIINKHGGHISADSEVGEGTTFTILLPASDKQVEEKAIVQAVPQTGGGKVLIMDDEEMIKESVQQLLTHQGYEVQCVSNGYEAVEMYKKALESVKPFDAVVLDLTVRGGMGGKEAIKKLLEIDPGIKAIVASGYSHDPVLANFREYGFCGVYAKKEKPEELLRTLHRAITG